MKSFFILIKINQLILISVILISCFTKSQIKLKDIGYDYLKKPPTYYRWYDLFKSQSLLAENDKSFIVNDFDFAFKIIHCAIGLSFCTAIVSIATAITTCFVKKNIVEAQLILYGLMIALWIPFTYCFLWMVNVKWSENHILSQYYRPLNWIVVAGSCVSLTSMLILDLILFFVANLQFFSSKMEITETRKSSVNSHPRLVITEQVKFQNLKLDEDGFD